MEALPPFGTAISSSVGPTFKTYAPLLVANATAIKSTKRETFTYGPHPRHALDVYYPTATTDTVPIFVFLYGGGLVRGDRILPMMPEGLVHANLGHFITEQLGCIAVVPDYRLISHGARFPSGGEDIDLVVEWVKGSFRGQRELFMMGNSAGGVHLGTWLYAPTFTESIESVTSKDASLRLRGVVMLSVPFHFRSAEPERAETLKAFYGDEIEAQCPLGLLEALARRETRGNSALEVDTLVLNGTLDPENEILEPMEDFLKCYKSILPPEKAKLLMAEMMEGQNHISPVLSLGTGKPKEEAWGYQVRDWMKSIDS